jgi:Flp pilus assembly protein TadG
MRFSGDDDSGSVATQTAILFPGMLLLVLLVVQAGLYYHASQRAAAAADRAVAAAAWVDGSEAAGMEAAELFLAGAPLESSSVAVDYSEDGQEVTATVTGIAEPIVPAWVWSVSASATSPRERFVPEDERETP